MAPAKQSNFVEGSMNDRVSAVPPADFMGEDASADYEKHFAMDWKAPELQFGRGDYKDVPGNRSSFMSVRSGMSSFTTRTGIAANNKAGAAGAAPRQGLFGKVKEKLRKSRSSWTVGGGDDKDDAEREDDNNSSFLANFPVPPVFKHTRSESMDQQRGHTSHGSANPASDFGVFQRNAAATAAAGGRPAPPPRADSLSTILPSTMDPNKRPTREEIAANYQSLLASGFFGTHAIQSTRFSPPGGGGASKLHRHSEPLHNAPSFAQRLEEEPEDNEGGRMMGGERSVPPSPLRQPPPVPSPSRAAPPPPPPPPAEMDVEMEMDEDESSESATPKAIPASSTVVYNPVSAPQLSTNSTMSPPPPPRTSSLVADTSMSPPPVPTQRRLNKPAQKANSLSFSAIPYTSTRPGIEPTHTQRPYRPPPSSLARFSVDNYSRSSRSSLDVQHEQEPRGVKRPFSSRAANESQTSFYTDRSSYDYDPMAMDGHGGIGLATTTAGGGSPEKVESGARSLFKRLKKSASRLSFRSQNNRGEMVYGEHEDGDGGDDGASELQHPPSRTSMSSTVRRSFSWRLGGGPSSSKPDTTTPSDSAPTHTHYHSSTNVSFSEPKTNIFGGDTETFSLNSHTRTNSMDNNNNNDPFYFNPLTAHPPVPANHAPLPPPTPVKRGVQGLPTIAASPVSPGTERNRLKKRDIRTRRLRRKEDTTGSPLKHEGSAGAMDWQTPAPGAIPASPSKRPRRSDASIFMRALDYKNEHGDEGDDDESEPEMPKPIIGGGGNGAGEMMDMPSAAPSEGMEGVEFSFHFPGRTRPGMSRANTGKSTIHGSSAAGGIGGPLAVAPQHVNRGLPSISNTLFTTPHKTGSVRVVRAE